MTTETLNGMDLKQLHETVDAINGDPEIAQFEFRNTNEWIQGGENRSTIQEFYGAKQWDNSRTLQPCNSATAGGGKPRSRSWSRIEPGATSIR